MKAVTLALVGGIALLVVWAYQRHAFDNILGLSIPHDSTAPMNAANINVTIKRTDATTVSPYGPMFNPAGVVTSTSPTGPVFSPAYQTALGRVHEPGGARDPFRDLSDGSSWMGAARDSWIDAERNTPKTTLSQERDAWIALERQPGSMSVEYLRGRLN